MQKIITLTVNPSVDKSTTVNGIKPTRKLRCSEPIFEPGGGGINVSRIINGMGGASQCLFMAGGPLGVHLTSLLEKSRMWQKVIPIQGWTRENMAVTDTINILQYRFRMPVERIYKWMKSQKTKTVSANA